MGQSTPDGAKTVDEFLDSTLESVDSAEQLVIRVAQEAGMDEESVHHVAMAARESMANAVVHGNKYSAHKKVHVSISKGRDRLMVTIADQGEGFDLKNLPDPLAKENLLRNSGRGIFLIRAYTDEFEIRRLQPAGTEVKFVKYFNRK